jgi:hypothetical protein
MAAATSNGRQPIIITFDVPGAAGTGAHGINPAGVITGNYIDASGATHGFLRDAGGTITTFDPAGSVDTIPFSINVFHGFLRAAEGTITTFDPAASVGTIPISINPAGVITGSYIDASVRVTASYGNKYC